MKIVLRSSRRVSIPHALAVLCTSAALVAQADASSDVQTRVQRLAAALADKHEGTRSRAAMSLGELGTAAAAAKPALVKALRDPDTDVRYDAVRALLRIGPDESMVQEFLRILTDSDDPQWNRPTYDLVIECLVKIGAPVIPTVVPMLRLKPNLQYDDEHQTWSTAAAILEGIGKPAVPALLEASSDPAIDDAVRGAIVQALGSIGSAARAGVPFLLETAKTGQGYHRAWAIEALGKIGPSAASAVPFLRETLRTSLTANPDTDCYATIRVLGEIGPAAKDAVPELREALKHRRDDVRRYAVEALAKIEGRAPAGSGARKKTR
jgi:HEAT repeat protein